MNDIRELRALSSPSEWQEANDDAYSAFHTRGILADLVFLRDRRLVPLSSAPSLVIVGTFATSSQN